MLEFSVFHQCYDNKKATDFIIREFRKHNPETKYYLLSDGGIDFSDVAEEHNCIYYHDNINTGLNYLDRNNAKILLSRIERFFETTGSTYGLYIEDDVLCRSKIELNRDINITMMNVPENKIFLYEIIKSHYNPTPNVDWYGACGGNFFKNIIFVDPSKKEIIDRFLDSHFDKQGGTIDQLLPMLYLICGLECSVNENLTEVHRNLSWENSSHPMVHGFKKMY